MVQSVGLSDQGLVRTSNQDRILVDSALGLYLVADGVGGYSHGEAAAEMAVHSGVHFVRASRDSLDASWPFGYDIERSVDENRLRTAIQLANRQICRLKMSSPELSSAGTTLVGVMINGSRAAIGNVGDSRVYLLRGGMLEQLTVDDTWVGQLIRGGALTEAQAKTHAMKNVVTQAMGLDSIDVHSCERELQDGDVLLLTTDGVHGVLEHSAMCSILSGCRSLDEGARRMIQAALDQGGPDNASCILLRYSEDRN
ncbi:MAG: PP2C family protein-serine/threonine phosphatase [Bryobacteraceae bacterium]